MNKGSWGKVRAFFDIMTDEGFTIKGFKIIEGINGLFVGTPSQKGKDDEYFDTVFIAPELREEVNHVALQTYGMEASPADNFSFPEKKEEQNIDSMTTESEKVKEEQNIDSMTAESEKVKEEATPAASELTDTDENVKYSENLQNACRFFVSDFDKSYSQRLKEFIENTAYANR